MVLEHIIIGKYAKEKLHYITNAKLEEGLGIVGDRYYYKQGTFNKKQLNQNVREISIFKYEDLIKVNEKVAKKLDFLDLRRNLIISGFDYEVLKNKEFTIGSAKLKIVRTAPPCKYLSRLLDDNMMRALKYIGGYRASIIKSGDINVKDEIILS